jgi:hypothetical protein
VGHQYVSTVVSALRARSAVGDQSASTVVSALSARSVVGAQSASTVVCANSVRSAVGHHSASTVVSALIARSAVGQEYASTVVSAISARSVAGVHTASTVVSAVSARSARSSERIINQITTSQSVLVPSPFTRPPPPPFLHKSLSHHEAGSKITVAEVQSVNRRDVGPSNKQTPHRDGRACLRSRRRWRRSVARCRAPARRRRSPSP